MTERTLTARQRADLIKALARCTEVRQYRRLAAVLEVDQGRSIAEVAATTGVSLRSVYGWIEAFRTAGTAALADQPRTGRPSGWDAASREVLQELLANTPEDYGSPTAVWTIPLLAKHLRHQTRWQMTEKTLRREVHELGYSWKRSRYVLAPDPLAEKKTRHHPLPANTGFAGSYPGGG